MLRTSLKTIFYVVQLTVCFVVLLEKTQPARFPAPHSIGRLPARHAPYKAPRLRWRQPPRRGVFSWRRLFFLLGYSG